MQIKRASPSTVGFWFKLSWTMLSLYTIRKTSTFLDGFTNCFSATLDLGRNPRSLRNANNTSKMKIKRASPSTIGILLIVMELLFRFFFSKYISILLWIYAIRIRHLQPRIVCVCGLIIARACVCAHGTKIMDNSDCSVAKHLVSANETDVKFVA